MDCLAGQSLMLQIEYDIRNMQTYYDMSFIDCQPFEMCPFSLHKHKLETTAFDCPQTGCSCRELHCRGAYLYDRNDMKTKSCESDSVGIKAHLCMELAPLGHYSGYDSDEMDDWGVTIGDKRPTGCGRYAAQTSDGEHCDDEGNTNCTLWHTVRPGDSCAGLQARYGLDWDTFYRWNHAVGPDCQRLDISYDYCVQKNRQVRREYVA